MGPLASRKGHRALRLNGYPLDLYVPRTVPLTIFAIVGDVANFSMQWGGTLERDSVSPSIFLCFRGFDMAEIPLQARLFSLAIQSFD